MRFLIHGVAWRIGACAAEVGPTSTLSSRTKTAAGEHETPVVLHYDDREAY